MTAQAVKRLPEMWEIWVRFLGWEDPGEGNGNASSTLAWEIPWTEEPDGLQFTGSQRVEHDWVTSLFTQWRGGCDRGLGAFTSVCLQKTSATTLIRVLSVIFWYSNNIFWLLHLEKVQSLQNWISLYVRESSLNIQQTSALRLNLIGRI